MGDIPDGDAVSASVDLDAIQLHPERRGDSHAEPVHAGFDPVTRACLADTHIQQRAGRDRRSSRPQLLKNRSRLGFAAHPGARIARPLTIHVV